MIPLKKSRSDEGDKALPTEQSSLRVCMILAVLDSLHDCLDTINRYQDTDVVLKKLSLVGVNGEEINSTEREKLMTSFLNELKVMLDMYSPRIIRVYGICTTNPNFAGLVIEYCPEGDVRSYLDSNKPLDTQQKTRILMDVAKVQHLIPICPCFVDS